MYLAMQKLREQRGEERTRRNAEARKTSVPLPPENDPQRLLRKLTKHRSAYDKVKSSKPQPWSKITNSHIWFHSIWYY
jgi:hypothetical protein